ncbi:hypothetical protein ACFQ3L_10155 [Lacticaseibacillus jixianensis]|uniref:Uncharacterized protein n=1 Tax=Lacticaseibacillus jixianensis TaxID=2486012 RepID=A0ABW4BB13_9LACO|nr:hypothetical protein [Lacticaseibacillus jixianensis]
MLARVQATFAPRAFSYYLDLAFEETVARDAAKPQPFGPDRLRRWWRHQDWLPQDQVLTAPSTTALAEQIFLEVTRNE